MSIWSPLKCLRRHIHHDMPPLHSNLVGLGNIWTPLQAGLGYGIGSSCLLAFDCDIIAPHAHARRVKPGLPGADVELPAVPWAAQHLARPAVIVFAGARRDD